MTLPLSVPSDGNIRVDFVATIADVNAPKVATELNAVTSQELTPYLTAEGWQPSTEQATVTDERLASTQTFEQPGRITNSLSVAYVHNPADPANNEAYTTLAEGTPGFAVVRYGVPRTDAYALADVMDIWPVKAGRPNKQWNGMNSVQTVSQKLFVTGDVTLDAVAVA